MFSLLLPVKPVKMYMRWGKEPKREGNWQIPHISIFIYLYFFSRKVEVDRRVPPGNLDVSLNTVLFKPELRKCS